MGAGKIPDVLIGGTMLEFDLMKYDKDAKKYAYIDESRIITDNGNVFTQFTKTGQWKRLKPRRNTNGYLRVTISRKEKYIHRLVASAFLNNPCKYNEVNHKDGNKENNNVNNLEWCNSSQNKRHAYETGLRNWDELKEMARLPRHKTRIFTPEQAKEMRASQESNEKLARKYNCSRTTIRLIKKGDTYKDV